MADVLHPLQQCARTETLGLGRVLLRAKALTGKTLIRAARAPKHARCAGAGNRHLQLVMAYLNGAVVYVSFAASNSASRPAAVGRVRVPGDLFVSP